MQSHSWNPALSMALLAALVGGSAALLIIQLFDPLFPRAPLAELSLSPSPEEVKIHLQAAIDFRSRNYAVDFAALGLCLGLAIGYLTTNRRRTISAIGGAVGGAVAGAGAGYLGGYYVALTMAASENQSLVQSTLFHFSVWACILVSVILVIASIHGPFVEALIRALAGLFAAMVSATAYTLVGSLMFSKSNLLLLIPETLTERCAWMISSALLVGFTFHFGLYKPIEQRVDSVAK